MSGAWELLRPLAFAVEPEQAHRLALAGLGLLPRHPPPPVDPRLGQERLGLAFASPVGIAAGFDKNAVAPDALLALGFGFVEVGTVTPRPQAGNPLPRLFRLPADGAVINRLGFNNEGHDEVHRRLAARKGKPGIVGVNVGANRDSPDREGDYAAGIARFADLARYITINVSSPNTPGLRDLQEKEALSRLLARSVAARDAAIVPAGRKVPLLLKIAPDMDDAALDAIVDTAIAAGIEGMIVSNTTVSRDGLTDTRLAGEAGGLSGRPLFRPSTAMLARVRRRAGGRLVLVGVGGIDSARTAFEKIAAGADLVQLYTGFVYRGPGLAREINAGLPALLDERGFRPVGEAVGSDTARWLAS